MKLICRISKRYQFAVKQKHYMFVFYWIRYLSSIIFMHAFFFFVSISHDCEHEHEYIYLYILCLNVIGSGKHHFARISLSLYDGENECQTEKIRIFTICLYWNWIALVLFLYARQTNMLNWHGWNTQGKVGTYPFGCFRSTAISMLIHFRRSK